MIPSQTCLVNQLTACLKAYYPVALEVFTKLHQRSTLVFLQSDPTPEQAKAASVEMLEATLRQGSHHRFKPPLRCGGSPGSHISKLMSSRRAPKHG